jgi:hypothetical protein
MSLSLSFFSFYTHLVLEAGVVLLADDDLGRAGGETRASVREPTRGRRQRARAGVDSSLKRLLSSLRLTPCTHRVVGQESITVVAVVADHGEDERGARCRPLSQAHHDEE